MLHNWQVVQSLLNQQPYNPIGIENEVSSVGVLISDHTAGPRTSVRPGYEEQLGAETHVKRAISCGV
jgi:hypothetical protein